MFDFCDQKKFPFSSVVLKAFGKYPKDMASQSKIGVVIE